MLWDPEIEGEPGVVQAQPGGVDKISAVAIVQCLPVKSSATMNLGG
jgi:hypothetical protein